MTGESPSGDICKYGSLLVYNYIGLGAALDNDGLYSQSTTISGTPDLHPNLTFRKQRVFLGFRWTPKYLPGKSNA